MISIAQGWCSKLVYGMWPFLCSSTHRNRQQVLSGAGSAPSVEPLVLNVTLCQVMVTLSHRGPGQAEGQDADWLGLIRSFVRETLTGGGKLSSKQLAALLEVVWRLVVSQKSRGEASTEVAELQT